MCHSCGGHKRGTAGEGVWQNLSVNPWEEIFEDKLFPLDQVTCE